MSKEIDNMDLIEFEPPRSEPTDKDIILEIDDGVAIKYLQKEYKRRHPQEVYWTMKSGKKINVKDMTDEHLLNAIKLIQKYEQEYDDYLEALGGYPE